MNITLFRGNWHGIGRHIYLRFVFGQIVSAAYPNEHTKSGGFETRGWGVTLHTGMASHHIGLCRVRFLWARQ